MTRARPFFARFLPFAALVALAVGCADSSVSDDGVDDFAIKASVANEKQLNLQEHVLVAVPARPASAKALGISTWDLFAGTDKKTGFAGAIFYASDANGDVKYAFSIDVVTNAVAFLALTKEGTPAAEAVDAKTADALAVEIEHLRTLADKARAGAAASDSRASDCAKTLAWGGLTLLAAGAVAGTVGIALWGSMIVGVQVGGLAALALGTTNVAVMALPGIVTMTGYAYLAFSVIEAPIEGVRENAAKCFR